MPVKCIVCKKTQNLIFKYSGFKYYKCKNCGLVSTYPLPSKADIIYHYQAGFKKGNYKLIREFARQYESVYKGFVNEIKKTIRLEGKNLKDMKVLDIGCFTGDFLLLISNEGALVTGIELQKEAVKIASKKLPSKIINKDISAVNFGREKFDIVTMFGLIEHVKDPVSLVKAASQIVKSKGLLVIQTPNSDSLFAKLLGKYWPPYTPVEHIHLFGKMSMQRVLKSNGFKIEVLKKHFKTLPIAYIYRILGIFGPETKQILDKISILYDFKKSGVLLRFYIGEMFVIARKK